MGCIELMELELQCVKSELKRLEKEIEWIEFEQWFNSQFEE